MEKELQYEGFPLDEELSERLLLCGRQLVREMGASKPIRMAIKQLDGVVLGRVEVVVSGRKVSAVVRRMDPLSAIEAAIKAVRQFGVPSVDVSSRASAVDQHAPII